MYCKNCGKEIAGGEKFCSRCGSPVEVLPKSPTPAEPSLHDSNKAINVEPMARQTPVRGNVGALEPEGNSRKPVFEEFDWNVSDYPAPEPSSKTEDIDFNWNATPSDVKDAPATNIDASSAALHTSSTKQGETLRGSDLDESLFGQVTPGQSAETPGDASKIDQFYTINKKNEEFQQLLNEEYHKVKSGNAIEHELSQAEKLAQERFASRPEDSSMESFLEREGIVKPYQPKEFESDILQRIEAQEAEREAKRAEEEARLAAIEQARLDAEAKKRAEEEARMRAEEEARLQAEAKLRADEEARMKAVAKKRAEEEARLKAEAELRAQQEAAKIRAQQEARLAAQAEAQFKAEQERKRISEIEAQRKLEEERAKLSTEANKAVAQEEVRKALEQTERMRREEGDKIKAAVAGIRTGNNAIEPEGDVLGSASGVQKDVIDAHQATKNQISEMARARNAYFAELESETPQQKQASQAQVARTPIPEARKAGAPIPDQQMTRTPMAEPPMAEPPMARTPMPDPQAVRTPISESPIGRTPIPKPQASGAPTPDPQKTGMFDTSRDALFTTEEDFGRTRALDKGAVLAGLDDDMKVATRSHADKIPGGVAAPAAGASAVAQPMGINQSSKLPEEMDDLLSQFESVNAIDEQPELSEFAGDPILAADAMAAPPEVKDEQPPSDTVVMPHTPKIDDAPANDFDSYGNQEAAEYLNRQQNEMMQQNAMDDFYGSDFGDNVDESQLSKKELKQREKERKRAEKERAKEAKVSDKKPSGGSSAATFGDESDKDKGGKGRVVLKVILVILVIVLAVEVVGMCIKVFASQSKAAEFIDTQLNKVIQLITGDDTEYSVIAAQVRTEPVEDKTDFINAQKDKNVNNNIKSIVYNADLSYNQERDGKVSDLVLSQPITQVEWGKDKDGYPVYYDEQVVGAIISFESNLVNLRNKGNEKALKMIDGDSKMYKDVAALKNKKVGTFDKLEIGEIRQAGSNYCVWVRETIDGNTVEKVYSMYPEKKFVMKMLACYEV